MDTVLIQSGKNIKYIYHSADIHIRILERHNEYSKVFENLMITLRDKRSDDFLKNNCVFVICGDIFHKRDKILPETIKLFDDFMTCLSKLLDVIIISGNHDCYQDNNHTDMISGILDIKQYSGIYYLKNTGYYIYNNLKFGVSSLLDKKFCDDSGLNDSYVNIALFHGGISGAVLDNGMIANSGVSPINFKGYDLVLLGDYHQHQFLNKKKTIAYPGSLIQQNFGESSDKGILEWDTVNLEAMFMKISNDYSFLKISDDQNLDNICFTKFSRIKFIQKNFESDDSVIKKELRKRTKIISFVKGIEFNKPVQEIESSEDGDNTTVVFDNFLKKYDTTVSEKLELINDHVMKKIISKSGENDNKRNCINWSISELQFKNVYIYGKDHVNTINFKELDGITGIIAENASGKTSIINIIMYSIFGVASKTKSSLNRNIINKNSKNYFTSIKIDLNEEDETIIIKRTGRNKNRKGKSPVMDEKLEVLSEKNGNIVILTEASKTATQELINKVLGTDRDSFLFTQLLNHTNYSSILNMTSSDISNIFIKLFKMEQFTEIQEIISSDIKLLTLEINSEKSKIQVLENIKENSSNPLYHDDEIVIKPEELTEDEIKAIHFFPDITPEHVKNVELDKSLINIENDILFYQSKMTPGYACLDNYQDKKIDELEKMLEEINFIKIKNTCYSEREYKLSKKYLNNFLDNLEFLRENKTLGDNIEKIYDLLNCVDNFIQCKEVCNEWEEYKEQLKSNEASLLLKTRIIESINFKSSEKIKKIKEQKIIFIKINKFIGINKKKKLELYNKYKISSEISEDVNLKIQEHNKNLSMLLSKNELYKIYKELYSNKNIPSIVMNKLVKNTQNNVNSIIYPLCGLFIHFENDMDNKWEIFFKKENFSLGVEQLSGFQRFAVDTTLKTVLGSKNGIFIVDESADCISENNLDNIDTIFDFLRQNFKNILFVSHNDALKNKVDSNINIDTDTMCSKIIQ